MTTIETPGDLAGATPAGAHDGVSAARSAAQPPAGASAWVEVDLDAIRANVAELDRLSGDALVLAVVKADAYGHGLVPAARAALRGGAEWLGVAQLTEALSLRAAGVEAPLLTWLFVPEPDALPLLEQAVTTDIDVTAGSLSALACIAAAARHVGRPARLQLKVDTGLGRGGALDDDWDALVDAVGPLVAEGIVQVTGTWTHFAWADAPEHPAVRAQQERFGEAVDLMRRRGLDPGLQHIANSAATLTNPSAHLDMVRPGLAVYGLSPVPDRGRPEDFGLREAMTVRARLALVKPARAGQGVSYGHEHHTEADTLLGLVPLGYADGIPRSAGGRGPMRVGGRTLPVAGRVCMDQVVLDLGAGSVDAAGDEVVVLGRGADGQPTAQDWAEAADTINYEIVTRMSSRLPRVHLGEVEGDL